MKISKIERGTPGGDTYHIKLDGKLAAKCLRNSSTGSGKKCMKDAGYGTWHPGTGACKWHGGESGRKPTITNGRYARITKMRLQDDIERYMQMDRAKLLDLSYELATAKAIFNEFMENFPSPEEENYGIWFNRFSIGVGTLGMLVERISKTESRNTITTAQVLYLRAVIADLLMKYIRDPSERTRAAKELAERVGGDMELDNFNTYEKANHVIPGTFIEDES